jgi:hypothetical protein
VAPPGRTKKQGWRQTNAGPKGIGANQSAMNLAGGGPAGISDLGSALFGERPLELRHPESWKECGCLDGIESDEPFAASLIFNGPYHLEKHRNCH